MDQIILSNFYPIFIHLIMVRFHSNFQIILDCTSSIEVTTLAPFSLFEHCYQVPSMKNLYLIRIAFPDLQRLQARAGRSENTTKNR